MVQKIKILCTVIWEFVIWEWEFGFFECGIVNHVFRNNFQNNPKSLSYISLKYEIKSHCEV